MKTREQIKAMRPADYDTCTDFSRPDMRAYDEAVEQFVDDCFNGKTPLENIDPNDY